MCRLRGSWNMHQTSQVTSTSLLSCPHIWKCPPHFVRDVQCPRIWKCPPHFLRDVQCPRIWKSPPHFVSTWQWGKWVRRCWMFLDPAFCKILWYKYGTSLLMFSFFFLFVSPERDLGLLLIILVQFPESRHLIWVFMSAKRIRRVFLFRTLMSPLNHHLSCDTIITIILLQLYFANSHTYWQKSYSLSAELPALFCGQHQHW